MHAGGVRTGRTARQFEPCDETAVALILELNITIHSLDKLAHDIQSDPTPAAAAMTDEKSAQVFEVSGKTPPVVGDPYRNSPFTIRLDADFNFSRMPVRHRILNQVRQDTVQGPSVGAHDRVATLPNVQIGPVTAQVINASTQMNWLEKKLAPGQVYEEE